VNFQSQAIDMTLEVVSDNVELMEHIMVDDEERSDFAELGIFSHLSSVSGC
jgi:hypothetical protein